MSRKEELQRRIESLQRQQERLLIELERYEPWEDFLTECPVGTVIAFDYRFEGGSTWYSYAALKYVNGGNANYSGVQDELWASTGPRAPKGFTSSGLADWFSRGEVRGLRRATSWSTDLS
jgi:hypothetical protein